VLGSQFELHPAISAASGRAAHQAVHLLAVEDVLRNQRAQMKWTFAEGRERDGIEESEQRLQVALK